MDNVYKYPQTMGAYNALMENMEHITEETLTRAITICEGRGDYALTREDIEQAIEQQA